MWHVRRRVTAVLIAASLAVAAVSSIAAAQSGENEARSPGTISKQAFHDDMRKLWEDHVTWTRMFIVSFAADLPDLGPTTDRLLQNQTDIGNAIKPFYGTDAGNELTALLRDHILTAADLLAAANSGDTAAFDEAKARWYANAREIARFLHAANPEPWPLGEMRAMMREHLDLTLAEAAHRLAGDYAQDIADYEQVHLAILEMADMLSSGIIHQFPEQFGR